MELSMSLPRGCQISLSTLICLFVITLKVIRTSSFHSFSFFISFAHTRSITWLKFLSNTCEIQHAYENTSTLYTKNASYSFMRTSTKYLSKYEYLHQIFRGRILQRFQERMHTSRICCLRTCYSIATSHYQIDIPMTTRY